MQQEWCSLKTCTHVVFSRVISLMQLYSLLTPAVVFCSCGCVSCSHLLLLRLCLLQSSSAPAVVSPAVIFCSCSCVFCSHLLLLRLCLLRSSAPVVVSPTVIFCSCGYVSCGCRRNQAEPINNQLLDQVHNYVSAYR